MRRTFPAPAGLPAPAPTPARAALDRLRQVGGLGRTAQHAAVHLGGPGSYVEEREDALAVGSRPGGAHAMLLAVTLPVGVACAWFFGVHAGVWWLGATILLLFVVAPLLALLCRVQWEVRPGRLALRGAALGRRFNRDYPVGADGAVRVSAWEERHSDGGALWPVYQAQLRCGGVWIGVAESGRGEPVRAFARRLASAARVPLVEDG